MQINGLSNGHDQSSHNVTNCIHNHSAEKKNGAGAAANSTPSDYTGKTELNQQMEGFSLSAWMKNTLSSGRKLLLRIWGEENTAATGRDSNSAASAASEGNNSTVSEEQIMAQIGDAQVSEQSGGQKESSHTAAENTHVVNPARAAAASSMVQPQVQQPMNAYFSAIEDKGTQSRNLWEKVKVRFQAIASQLSRHSSGRNTFQAKQEQNKEDLRRRSHYHGEDQEIDCILTDDSYLLDSYDRKGGYSQLTTKK